MRFIVFALCCLLLPLIITRSLSLSTATLQSAQEPNWHDMLLGLVKEPDISQYERVLGLACRESTAQDLQQKVISSDESVALQSALIAKILLERLRNNVNFSGDIRQDFFAQYHQKCSRFLSSVPQVKFFEQNELTEQLLSDHAQILLQFALTKLQLKPLSPYQAYVYTVQWLYYNLKDDHQAAQKSAKLAILKHGKERHIIDLSEKYSYLGTSLLQLGHFREALFYMRKGLVTTLAHEGEQQYADAHFGLGFAYLKAGDYDSAKRYFELFVGMEFDQGESVYLDLSNCRHFSVRAAKGLVNLGKIDRINGDLQAALEKHQCAISRLQEEADYYYYVAVLEKAKVLDAQGQYAEAKVLAQFLANSNRIFDSHQLQALLLILAADLKQQPPLLDLSTEQRILTLVGIEGDEVKFPREFIEFNQLKMNHAAQIGDEHGFIQYARAGFAMIRKYRQTGLLSDAWLTTQYAFVEHYVSAIYSNAGYSNEEKFESIINVLDSYYALNYFDARKTQLSDQQQSVSAELKQLMHNLKEAETKLINGPVKERRHLRIQLDNANEALMAYAALKPAKGNKKPKLSAEHSIKQIQSRLKDKEMLLRYFVTQRHSMALIVTNQALMVHPLPAIARLRQSLDELKTWTGRKQITQLMKSDAFRSLLPLEYIAKQQINKLVIVPDDVLHRVPFAAIDTAEINKKYEGIGKQLQIVRSHSVKDYFFAEIEQQRLHNVNQQVTIFADPALSENLNENSTVLEKFERLPHTAKEAGNIKASYSDIMVSLYQAEQVTNQNLLSEDARHAKILHIATHGYYNPEIPDIVGIATFDREQNGFLSLTELLSKPFYSHLVVISGCETMLGKYYKGSGMKSFTRGFLSKGAGSVLGTLWKVPDRSTALFMSHFYGELRKNNGNTLAALKAARFELANHKEFYDPFYWSGFVLTSTNTHFEQITFK